MPAPRDCPETDCWRVLLDDTASAEERQRCERHLESCPACQERLDRADRCNGDWLGRARRVGDPTAAPADPALVGVLERLHEGPPPERADASGPADLYFLQPSDLPGILGTLGGYEVLEVIGQGGMGVVLKAFEPALNRFVAIKVMAAAVAGSALARRRFTREAQAAAAVCHEHVVAVHGVHEVEGLPYLVMQYVAGESLQDRIDRAGPLEVTEAVRIGMQTASGLAAAHAQGLIHRDIKPANLLLENGVARVKITDFGLARMADDIGLTRDGVVAGTPEYMAPEQARGEPVDHRADLYSLGAVLYACCTGRPPFHGTSAVAVLRRVSDEQPAPIRSRNPGVTVWLEALVARLMAKAPADRFQSAAEVAQLLEGYLAHLQQPSAAPAPSLPGISLEKPAHPPRHARRLPPWLWLSALAALLVVGLGISGWLRPGIQPSNQTRVDPPKPPAPEGGNEQRPQGPIVADLPAGTDKLPPSLALFGPDVESVIKADPQGWRITLPAGREQRGGVGVQVLPRLSGDFAITLGYEILAVGQPVPHYGAGTVMQVWFDDPSSASAILSRGTKPFGQVLSAHRIIKGPDGKEKYLNNVETRTVRPRGKLRLARTGSTLQYLVAEEGEDFRAIQSVEIGTADVWKVSVSCQTMSAPIALDVRWTELDVRADRIDGQDQPPASGRKQERIVADLPAGTDKLPPSLSLIGPDVESVVKADPQGWRITLPADRGDTRIVGVQVLPRLGGDFDITLGYELLGIGRPLPKYGAGVWVRVWFDTPEFLSAMISRNNSSDGKADRSVFVAHKILKDPGDKEKYVDNVTEKTQSSRGKLRLLRTGSRLQYLVAEEGKDFKTIQSLEVGTADVREAQVFCSTMYTPIALDVRWRELTIRADRIDGQDQPAALEPLASADGGSRFKGAALVVVLGLGLTVALVVWLLRFRRGRKLVKGRDGAPVRGPKEAAPSAAAVVCFACSGCGKQIKVKAELAGKKGKCPQCGNVLLVPGAHRASPPASGPVQG